MPYSVEIADRALAEIEAIVAFLRKSRCRLRPAGISGCGHHSKRYAITLSGVRSLPKMTGTKANFDSSFMASESISIGFYSRFAEIRSTSFGSGTAGRICLARRSSVAIKCD